jgi:hypothetical protein
MREDESNGSLANFPLTNYFFFVVRQELDVILADFPRRTHRLFKENKQERKRNALGNGTDEGRRVMRMLGRGCCEKEEEKGR